MKTKRIFLILITAMLLVSILKVDAYATTVNGRILSISGEVNDDTVIIPLGEYSCYYNFNASTHKLQYNLDIDPISVSMDITSYVKMNYSIKVIDESYEIIHNLYLNNPGTMTEEQYMLYIGVNFSGSYIENYSGSWSTSPGSQSNDHLIDDDTLIYMHHVFYSKSGNTYYGSLTFNSAFAVPSDYTDYKYYY